MDRQRLYERINLEVDLMFEQRVKKVQALIESGLSESARLARQLATKLHILAQ